MTFFLNLMETIDHFNSPMIPPEAALPLWKDIIQNVLGNAVPDD